MSGSKDDTGWQTESGWQSDLEWGLEGVAPTQPSGEGPLRATNTLVVMAVGGTALVILILAYLVTSPAPDVSTIAAEPTPTEGPASIPSAEPDNEASEENDLEGAVDIAESRAAEEFRRQLTRAAAAIGIVYRSDDELTLIRFDDAEVSPLADGFDNEPGADVGLLRTGDGRTYAINVEFRAATVVATEGFVVETMFEGLVTTTDLATGRVEASQTALVAPLSGGSPTYTVDLPVGATPVILPDVGMVFVGAEGSDLVGPGTLIHLSNNFITAGNDKAWLEKACSSLRCGLRLIDFTTRELIAELPDAFSQTGDSFVVSPDAQHIVRISPDGSGEFYSVDGGGISFVTNGGMHHPTFASDGSFLIWLDTSDPDRTFLRVLFLAPRQFVAIDLSTIGASTPDGTEVLLLSSITNP